MTKTYHSTGAAAAAVLSGGGPDSVDIDDIISEDIEPEVYGGRKLIDEDGDFQRSVIQKLFMAMDTIKNGGSLSPSDITILSRELLRWHNKSRR